MKLNKPVTKKPKNARMGKGKGKISLTIDNKIAGSLIFELSFLKYNLALKTLKNVKKKFKLPTRVVSLNKKEFLEHYYIKEKKIKLN